MSHYCPPLALCPLNLFDAAHRPFKRCIIALFVLPSMTRLIDSKMHLCRWRDSDLKMCAAGCRVSKAKGRATGDLFVLSKAEPITASI